ncbi:hypothetical protein EV215_2031 [Hypnocyclicus thermotrophus]|uniref:Uncharacterized protein n=1 Tax=Hypnocyclicus thermotrophus TaxID=1627895 RepID=A0AA46DXF7_9FUSO|nr:hypothetical protein [Hypnocyclicus thermotrophus]TDT67353.1 hypothetical protein EV215_2031 [Hypnocyclicus thermotrophus]
MKKVFLGMFFIYSTIFAIENLETSNNQKLNKVEGLDLIAILVENENYNLANDLLKNLSVEEKQGEKYYKNLAKIKNGLSEKDEAIKYYKYILENFDNIDKLYYNFELLKIYVTDEKYNNEVIKTIKKIKKFKLDKKSKNKLKELERIYKKKANIEYLKNIELGLGYNDNLYTLKENKIGDMYTNMNFTLMGVNKISDNYNLTFFTSYRNQLYSKETTKTNHNIFIGGQPQYFINDTLNISAPSMFKLTFENGKYSEFGINIGVLSFKTINDKSNINFGIDIGYKNNKIDNYKGTTMTLYSTYNYLDQKEILNTINFITGKEKYNESTYDNNYINIGINRTQKFKEKYNMNYGYILSYKLNSLEIDGVKKKDISHNIAGNISGKTIWEMNWSVGYTFIYGNSNINSYDYINNIISTTLSREF